MAPQWCDSYMSEEGKRFVVEEWSDTHPRIGEARKLIEAHDQEAWVNFVAEWHISSHLLVAQAEGVVAGFLRYVVQPIGSDADCPPLEFLGEQLTEAKVLAFGVAIGKRRQKIGRRLQIELIARAKALGCYQVRSHSGGKHKENHQLKLSLGFGVHPIVRGDDRAGVYFVLPLRQRRDVK
jgi:GNAT superfamily N-acetyltransferase